MLLIIGFLLLAGLLAFRRYNTRLRLESEAAAAEKTRYDRRLNNFTHGIRDAIEHKRRRDEYEARTAGESDAAANVKYR